MAYVLSISDIMKVDEWPETLLIERERLSLIGNQLRKQITIAASFLVLAASAPRQYVLVKEQLRSAAKPISDQTDIVELPHSLAELAVQKLSPFNLDQDLIIAIRGQLSSLNDEHPIYKLLWVRFYFLVMSSLFFFIRDVQVTFSPQSPYQLNRIHQKHLKVYKTFKQSWSPLLLHLKRFATWIDLSLVHCTG